MRRTLKGESMLPFLRALDVCVSESAEPALLKKGDIVVYEKSGDLVVHRILDVDLLKRSAIIKGDNLPADTSEEIPFSAIKEKVVSVEKNGRVISFENRVHRTFAGGAAFLSRYDLLPGPLKRRVIDPVLIALTRLPVYIFLRKTFYGGVSFTLGRQGDKRVLYAFVGGRKSAEATFEQLEKKAVSVCCHVRLRDRNNYFEKIFLRKVRQTASAEYGPGCELKIEREPAGGAGTASDDRGVDLYPALCFSPSMMSDARKFVIMCSRLEMPDGMKKEAALLASGKKFDWGRVLELADTYRVAPFVYGHLQAIKDAGVPELVKAGLRSRAGTALRANAAAIGEIKLIEKIFRDAGLEPIFLKSAALLADVYRTPGLRFFNDIDILVKEENERRAGAALESAGYAPCESEGVFPGYRSQTLYRGKSGVYVDLHAGLLGRRQHDRMLGMDREGLWKRKRRIELDGTEVYALDLSHAILYHCLHLASQHSFSGLIWYVDLHEMLEYHAGRVDWSEIAALAARYRIKRPVYYVLSFTKSMMGSAVPLEVLESLAGMERKLDRWIFGKIKSSNREVDYLAELAMFDSALDAVKFAALNFARYPRLIPHFAAVAFRMVKGMVCGAPDA